MLKLAYKKGTTHLMLHYLCDTDKTKLMARVIGVGEDSKGAYLLLDETIFYPQGGGQPADQGIIKTESETLPIHFVSFVEENVRHYTIAPIFENLVGQSVLCEVNHDRRYLNARYHTAGHILADVVTNIYPQVRAVKGHQFPGEAYVEFIDASSESMDIQTVQEKLVNCISDALPVHVYEIAKNDYEDKYGVLPYPTPNDKPFRVVGIGSFPPVPCGGTHVKNAVYIGHVKIRKIKNKKCRVKVSYEL
jgi:alanyl-tRNA synthetase